MTPENTSPAVCVIAPGRRPVDVSEEMAEAIRDAIARFVPHNVPLTLAVGVLETVKIEMMVAHSD